MKKLNKTLFELDIIFDSLSHGKTWLTLIDLKNVKHELVSIKNECLEQKNDFDIDNDDEISFIDKQLTYVNKNIKTFEEALLCHESKIVEKRKTMDELGIFWLN